MFTVFSATMQRRTRVCVQGGEVTVAVTTRRDEILRIPALQTLPLGLNWIFNGVKRVCRCWTVGSSHVAVVVGAGPAVSTLSSPSLVSTEGEDGLGRGGGSRGKGREGGE